MRNLHLLPSLILLLDLLPCAAAPGPARLDAPVELAPVVERILEDPALSTAQRRHLTIFHGQWNVLEDPTVPEQAMIALLRYDLGAAALADPAVDPLLRASALLARGDSQAVLDLLQDRSDAPAMHLRAEGLLQLGRGPEAAALLGPLLDPLDERQVADPDELLAWAQALVLRAELAGRPGDDHQRAMAMLGRAHQELDRLHWPSKLAEGELLLAKDNPREAAEALREALGLNPRAGRAWYALGRIAVDAYDFEAAAGIVARLRAIHPQHLLADLLEAHMLLRQRDAAGARRLLEAARTRFARHGELAALAAAAAALAFDAPALAASLAECDRLAPGGGLGHFTTGRYLAAARQYDDAQAQLRAAIQRRPAWPAPRIELGLMLMQRGAELEARDELGQAARLDPFNRRAANQLKLVEALLDYEQIRSEHFVIKYRAGIDEVLARDMPEALERIYRDVTAVFQHRPARPTLIELMPDESWFAVRITGMPEIWTVAASTGDVIALMAPREGPGQRGGFDWVNVVRHEFVHTVTLDQTRNRVPHWFTEACAVSQETTDRDYATCRLLAAALHEGRLFELDQIDWAFIRPRGPADRALAYAQAHWMLQYIVATGGHAAVVDMLAEFRRGATGPEALERTTGSGAGQFMADFRAWAASEVAAWGLARPLEDPRVEALRSGSAAAADSSLQELVARHGDHPDLLELQARRSLARDDYEPARRDVLRYAAARPVDPWSSRALARLAIEHGRPEDAIGPLELLDRLEVSSGAWAAELSRLHRAAGRLDLAAGAIGRALARGPYDAGWRELAAAIDLQRSDADSALRHIRALTLLEPDRAGQWLRLAAIEQRLGHDAEARAAASKARRLDPGADVGRFLPQGSGP